jgi:predicted RNA-binding Zn-ribbon protein involved in translation (DUF1610 family)
MLALRELQPDLFPDAIGHFGPVEHGWMTGSPVAPPSVPDESAALKVANLVGVPHDVMQFRTGAAVSDESAATEPCPRCGKAGKRKGFIIFCDSCGWPIPKNKTQADPPAVQRVEGAKAEQSPAVDYEAGARRMYDRCATSVRPTWEALLPEQRAAIVECYRDIHTEAYAHGEADAFAEVHKPHSSPTTVARGEGGEDEAAILAGQLWDLWLEYEGDNGLNWRPLSMPLLLGALAKARSEGEQGKADAIRALQNTHDAELRQIGAERDEARDHANALQADIEADQDGRLELRKRYGARENETMIAFIQRLGKEARLNQSLAATPVPILLACPSCGARHIDEGEFATKVHHTHACQSCGLMWRPAVVPTVGVQFLPGFKNEKAVLADDIAPPDPLPEVVPAGTRIAGEDAVARQQLKLIVFHGVPTYFGDWGPCPDGSVAHAVFWRADDIDWAHYRATLKPEKGSSDE